jgi:hypothetical protein
MRLRSVGASGIEFKKLQADYAAFIKDSKRLTTNEGLTEYMDTLYSLIDRCHALSISYDDLGGNE